MKHAPLTVTFPLLAALMLCPMLIVTPASARPVDADADALLQRVVRAYRDTKTYRSVQTFSHVVKQGRWTQTQTGNFRVALDRTGDHPRLLLDRPGIKLVVDHQTLRLRVPDIPGRYLDTKLDQPLAYATLTGLLPQLSSPTLPDLAFLLASDPVSVLGGFAPAQVKAKGDNQLVLSNDQGTLTLELDPRTWLIQRAVMTPPAGQGPQGPFTREVYEVKVTARNQPLSDDTFAFDAEGSAVQNIYAFMGQPQPSPTDTSSTHPLIGQTVPRVKLATLAGKPVDLTHPQADVTVIDFFATWCVWCRVWLPNLDHVRQWAEDHGKSVQVYVVSVDEDPPAMRKFWDGIDTELSLLMPDDPKAVQNAFGSTRRGPRGIAQKSLPLPTTVVIQGNTIKDVHQGVTPDMRQRLQQQIEQLLKNPAK